MNEIVRDRSSTDEFVDRIVEKRKSLPRAKEQVDNLLGKLFIPPEGLPPPSSWEECEISGKSEAQHREKESPRLWTLEKHCMALLLSTGHITSKGKVFRPKNI